MEYFFPAVSIQFQTLDKYILYFNILKLSIYPYFIFFILTLKYIISYEIDIDLKKKARVPIKNNLEINANKIHL